MASEVSISENMPYFNGKLIFVYLSAPCLLRSILQYGVKIEVVVRFLNINKYR
ncbi:MAG: hypothetical protein HQK74_00790, partial [Desulfamplus sp.]|nr:hypothetical protein [Desulfamplus sp.]